MTQGWWLAISFVLAITAAAVAGQSESKRSAWAVETQPSHGRLLAGWGTDGVLGYKPAGPDGPGYSIRHVPGEHLRMPGGWYAVELDYKFPQPDPARWLDPKLAGMPCWHYAMFHIEQPMTDLYKRRHAPPTALPGGVPRTMFRWEGNITRQQFDAVPEKLPCNFCMVATRYQIIDGHLYRQGNPASWAAVQHPNLEFLQDMLLPALHLWDLPDMDFILHNGDGCPSEGYPMLSWTICRNRRQGGFGFPSYTIFKDALGPLQMEAYHQCIVTRYNHTNRRPVVFFRGSTTDPNVGGVLDMAKARRMARVKLHKIFSKNPIFDTKIDNVPAADDEVKAYLQPLAPRPRWIEDYNEAAIILDVDGHGISGRFGHQYSHFNTPIVKQASNNSAYFEHLVAPWHMFELYRNDLLNLPALAHRLTDEWRANPKRLIKMAEQFQGFATVFLHQVAVLEAVAYTLLEWSKRQAWKTVRDPTFSEVPFSSACTTLTLTNLPKAFCEEMQARPAKP